MDFKIFHVRLLCISRLSISHKMNHELSYIATIAAVCQNEMKEFGTHQKYLSKTEIPFLFIHSDDLHVIIFFKEYETILKKIINKLEITGANLYRKTDMSSHDDDIKIYKLKFY